VYGVDEIDPMNESFVVNNACSTAYDQMKDLAGLNKRNFKGYGYAYMLNAVKNSTFNYMNIQVSRLPCSK
jgi:hypothetical protein